MRVWAFHFEVEGERLERLAIKLLRYRPLEPKQVNELVHTTLARFPKRTRSVTLSDIHLISSLTLTTYDRDYATWCHVLQAFLLDLHLTLKGRDQRKTVALVLDCNGVRPAEEVHVIITASGAILLEDADQPYSVHAMNVAAPSPPKLGSPREPVWRPEFRPGTQLVGGNPSEFYYSGQPGQHPLLFYKCKEFSHHSAEKKLVFILMPDDGRNAVCNGSLECKVTARNLPFAVTKRFGVSLTFAEEDAFPLAEKLVYEIVLEQ